MTHSSPKLNTTDHKIYTYCERELIVDKVEEIKQQLAEVWQRSNTAFE